MTTEQENGPARALVPQADRFGLVTLVSVVLILAVSFWNVWTVNRLAQRVGELESLFAGPPSSGPDPSLVYDISTEGAPSKGPENAAVTLVEFSDFQCPFCARAGPILRQLEDTYSGSVRIVWKHLPLPMHEDAISAAIAAEAARNQGRFWEFHDSLFANQDQLHPDDLRQYAVELGLDIDRFEADLLTVVADGKIEADMAEAEALGLSATPSFFVNGRFVAGAQPYEVFEELIDEELARLNALGSPGPSN